MESNSNFDKCPYSKQLKEKGMNFPGMIPNIGDMSMKPGNHPNISTATEETVDTTFDAEKGIRGQSIELINPNYLPKAGKCPFGMDEKPKSVEIAEKGKCPMGHDSKNLTEESKREAFEKEADSKAKVHGGKSLKDESDSEDEFSGGCPVYANNVKKDPVNKIFESHYEIPKFGPYDFMFMMRGSLEPEEFFEKTKKIRAMPRHLKYSLFVQHQPNLIKVHEKEFPMVYFLFDDIKRKADRLYKRKKFREAVDHYTFAYGLLKWVQFKDKTRQENLLKRPTLDPILDDDIDEKIVYLDDIKVEEDSYKASVVYLLNNLSYAYMELRQYTEVIDTLDEAISIAEDKVPDLFFRRSQARACNKFSDNEELEKAMQDIDKAISLKDDPLYHEQKQFLNKVKEDRIKKAAQRTDRILEKAKKSYQKVKDKHVSRDEIIFCKKDKDALTQYKIMKEMKSKYSLAIKFFTESKNEEQLELCYKEIESFMDTFDEFKFFLRFSTTSIPPQMQENLTEEERVMLEDDTMIKIVDELKFKICEDIFGSGNFNFELFQYALERVFEEERKQEEEEQKRLELSKPKVSWLTAISKSNFLKYLTGGVALFSIGTIGAHYYLYSTSSAASYFK